MSTENTSKLTVVITFESDLYDPEESVSIGGELLGLADEILTENDNLDCYLFIKDFYRDEWPIVVDHAIIDKPGFYSYKDGSRDKIEWCMYSKIASLPDDMAHSIYRDLVKLLGRAAMFDYAIMLEGSTTDTSTNMNSFKGCANILQSCAKIREESEEFED